MSGAPVVELASLRLLVLTEGLPDAAQASAVLNEAHRRGAAFGVIVRAYEASGEERIAFVRELRRNLAGVPIILAGAPAEAREARAHGVHLGRRVASVAEARACLDPEAWISVPAHTPQDIAAAEREGAYAALVSPVLGVPAKGPPLGFSGLSCFVASARPTRLRTFALGGITSGDVGPCLRAGVDGVAVIRAVWAAEDPAKALTDFAAALAKHA